MRLKMLRLFTAFIICITAATGLNAQNCLNTGLNGSVLNLPCATNCVNVPVRLPDIKQTTDYILNEIPYNPYNYLDPANTTYFSSYTDDDYGAVINLPFPFCFYDSMYTSLVMGSNGLITFDVGNANCSNAYTIDQPIPFGGATQCAAGGTYYPRAAIMGAYSDLDPRDGAVNASPSDRTIQWRIEGTAPCRKFVAVYWKVGVFGGTCGVTTPNIFQMVLYESTGVIEVYIERKACQASTSNGHAILGIQNWPRNQAVFSPGRNNTIWNETFTAYRFTPSGGASRFVSSEAYDLGGTLLGAGVTANTTPGIIDVTFPTFCPAGLTGQYIIRNKFTACDNPTNILQSDDTITINKTNNLDATVAVTPTSCGLAPDGTATLTVPAGLGTGPFTYTITPVATGSAGAYTGLAAGNYTLTVNDAAGCSSTIDTNIVSTGVLAVDYTPFATSCYGAANGGLDIAQPINGTAPFTYTVVPETPPNLPIPSATGNWNNLAAGNYFLNVIDNAGCKAELLPFQVEPGPSITLDFTTVAPSCDGAFNGSITVSSPDGTAPIGFSINAGPYQTNGVFAGLSSEAPDGSSYFISVLDANGCKIDFYPIQLPAGTNSVLGSANGSPTTCNGASNGSVEVSPMGTGPFEYSIDGGTTWQASNIFPNLASGNYNIIIREGGVCRSAPIAATVAAGATLTGAITSTSTDCAGVDNGTVTVTADAGFTGPFEYQIDGGAYQNSNVFTGVSAGNHNIKIRGTTSGCSSEMLPVTVMAGTVLTGSATSTPTDCAGVSNGTVTVTEGAGFTGPFTYSIDGGAYQAANTFAGVSAGSHTVRVRSGAGCVSADIAVTVNAGTVLTGTATSTSTACAGVSNGSITVTEGTGFTGPFTYSLDGGAYQASNLFNGVGAGAHNVRVQSAAGCISNDIAVTVTAGTVLTGTATPTAVTCNGSNDGVITAAATNGSGPYTYSIDAFPAQASNIFNGVTAGTHNIIIYDGYGCISNQIPVTVTQPPVLTAPAPVVVNVNCYAELNGSITLAPSGGVGPYTYSLDNINFVPGNVFQVGQGAYTINIHDANGCGMMIGNVVVTQPAALNAFVAGSANATCVGGDGTIGITASGGTSPYQYSSGGAFQPGSTLSVDPGTYDMTIRDAHGCEFAIDAVTIGLTDNLTVAAATPAPICEGTSVQLQATGNGASFTWTPGGSLGSATGSTVSASPVTSTTYTVTAQLGICVATADVTVDVLAAPIPDAGEDPTICYGRDAQLQATPAGMTSYTWSPSRYLSNPNIANPVVTQPDRTTTYTLNVVDANNCASLVAGTVTVNVTPPIKINVTPVDTVVSPGAQIQLTATSIATSYTWSPAVGLSSATIPNPVATAPGVGEVVEYQVIGRTAADCIGEAYVTIKVYEGPDLFVPTGFTPNGDGRNDLFTPFPVGIKSLSYFRIFNRWGQLIFSTTELNKGWDGRLAGKEQGSGVYVWMIEGISQDNKVIQKKGSVTLLR